MRVVWAGNETTYLALRQKMFGPPNIGSVAAAPAAPAPMALISLQCAVNTASD